MTLKPTLRKLSLFLFCLATSWTAQADTVIWTNTAGGNWNVAENWWPNQIPSPLDNVFITNAGAYTVVIDSDFGTVDTLTLGDGGGGQRLSVALSGIFCATSASIAPGSELHISESWLISLQADVAGTVTWDSGFLSGTLIISSGGVLNISGGGDKIIEDNASIVNYGQVHWTGGSVLGNDVDFTFERPTIVNEVSGVFDIDEGGAVGVLPTAGPDASIVFQNAGLLRKGTSAQNTEFGNATFENSGTVQLSVGKLVFTTLTGGGTSFTSSGLFEVGPGTAVELAAGNCLFLPGHQAQGDGYFGLVGGVPLTVFGEIVGKLDWSQATWSGQLTIATNGVLNISGDTDKFLQDAASITNYGIINWGGIGSVYATDLDSTPEHPTIVNMPGGIFEIQNDSALGLASSSGGPGRVFVFNNQGLVRKLAGPATTVFMHMQFENSGTVRLEQGTLEFGSSSGTPPAWTSSGLFEVAAGTSPRARAISALLWADS